MWNKLLLAAPLATALLALPIRADESRELAVDGPGWQLDGEARVGSHIDRAALQLRTGNAVLEDVTMEDGTVELDLAVTPHRAFVYLKFRIQAEGEYETFYFRSHKSELPDAIQYTPVFQGASNWQLYHGAGYTAATALPPERWIPVKLVVQGDKAAVFVDDMVTPKIITSLVREPGPGKLALGGFVPRQSAPDGVDTANFSNIVVRPGVVDFTFPDDDPSPPPAGVVERWQVSAPFVSQHESVPVEVPAEVSSGPWQALATDATGLLVFDRHLERPATGPRRAVAARLILDAEEAGRQRFDFGYSDRVSVLLNGELLMSGNATYSFNFPRRQGLIGLDQGTLYLPLAEGRNELVLIVDEVFGGWGLMGQFPEAEGFAVVAPTVTPAATP